jgi:signal transduction histidine kinase
MMIAGETGVPPFLVVTLDAAGRITGIQPQAGALFQTDPAALLGRPLVSLFPDESATRLQGLLERERAAAAAPGAAASALEQRKTAAVEPLQTAAGSPIEAAAAPWLGSGPGGVTLVLRSISPGGPGAGAMVNADRFLSEAMTLLSSSLDYRITLTTLAQVALPHFADWSIVDMVAGPGESKSDAPLIRRLVVAHRDPALAEVASRVQAFPPDPEAKAGVGKVLRTGEAEFYPDLSGLAAEAATRDPEHAALIATLGARSGMCLPLIARGRILGAITFVLGHSGRRYGPADLALARDLAGRAALAVDNALLYEESREAVRARETFLSIAAHELRGPLTPLQLQLQLALRSLRAGRVNPEALQEQIVACERHVRRLGRLIQALLEVSRIAAGRLELVTEDLDLAQVARDVVTRYAPEADAAGSTVDLTTVSCPGRWDRLRLEQVIGNLLHNAIKYGRGRPIRLESGPAPGLPGWALVRVQDQGEGITTEHLPRIFERFERAGATRRVGGLGLGLHIVKQILEAMGGRIEVRSQVGLGSVFTALIPCEDGSARAQAQAQAQASSGPGARAG